MKSPRPLPVISDRRRFFAVGYLLHPLQDHAMTRDTSDRFDGEIRSETEFEAVLRELLISAYLNGIDPGGAWDLRNGDNAPDWEVMVTELAKQNGTD
ncbi:MAG: hypothetical protein ABEJ44_06360 [Halanaeroarchaeum sp.]